MRKKLLLCIVMLCGIASVTACGSPEDPTKKDVEKALEREDIITDDNEYELKIDEIELNDDKDEATVKCTLEKKTDYVNLVTEYEVEFSLRDDDTWKREEVEEKDTKVSLEDEIPEDDMESSLEDYINSQEDYDMSYDEVSDVSFGEHDLDKDNLTDEVEISYVWTKDDVPFYFVGIVSFGIDEEDYTWKVSDFEVESTINMSIDREDYFEIEVDESVVTLDEDEFNDYIQSDLEANAVDGVIPELTDEYVQEVYSYLGISTVDEYLEEYKRTILTNQIYSQVWDGIVGSVVVVGYDYEDFEEQVQAKYNEFEYSLSSMGMDIEAYLEQMDMTEEAFLDECRATVEEEMKYYGLRDYIAEAEGLSVSDEEYQIELQKTLILYDIESEEEFYEQYESYGYDEEYFRDNFLTNKVVEFICDNVVVAE